MSKEIRIGVPGSGPGSGVPAFAVSRDSAGILIGVRDPAAPQFAVSRDAEGLLLSAWPITGPSYVVSGYVLGLVAATTVRVSAVYYDGVTHQVFENHTEITTSLTEWQRVSRTQPIPPIPAIESYVSAKISCSRASPPAGAYWTAMQLEVGTVASAYGVGAANLLLNSEFAADLSHWWADTPPFRNPPVNRFSREGSLPSSPVSGVTTALKYVSSGNFPGVWDNAVHDLIALPTP